MGELRYTTVHQTDSPNIPFPIRQPFSVQWNTEFSKLLGKLNLVLKKSGVPEMGGSNNRNSAVIMLDQMVLGLEQRNPGRRIKFGNHSELPITSA